MSQTNDGQWHHVLPCGLSAGSRQPSLCFPWLSPRSWMTGWCCFRSCWPFHPAGGPPMTNQSAEISKRSSVLGFTWASTSMARYWNMSWRSLMLLSSFRISSRRDPISLRACLVALSSIRIWIPNNRHVILIICTFLADYEDKGPWMDHDQSQGKNFQISKRFICTWSFQQALK